MIAYARYIGYAGDGVIVVDRTMGKDGYCWYKVKFELKAVGWVRGDFLCPIWVIKKRGKLSTPSCMAAFSKTLSHKDVAIER